MLAEMHTIDTDALGYLLLEIAADRFQCQPAQLDAEQRREAERIALRQVEIQQRVLASAEAQAVLVPDTEVAAALQQVRARYGSSEEFERELAVNDLDEARLWRALARELRVDAVLARVAARTPVIDDTEARLYYYLNPQRFQQPETRVARHILITINPTFAENKRDVAQARVQEIARRVSRKPNRFAEQAMKHSECPTALDGGLLGRIKRGTLYPELEAALFALSENTVGDVVESPLGFHILYCEKIHRAGTAPLNEVLPALREQLQAREASRTQRRWIAQLFKPSAEMETETDD